MKNKSNPFFALLALSTLFASCIDLGDILGSEKEPEQDVDVSVNDYLEPSHHELYFASQEDGITYEPQIIEINTGNLSWEFIDVPEWINVTPQSGTGQQSVEIAVDSYEDFFNNREQSIMLVSTGEESEFSYPITIIQEHATVVVDMPSTSVVLNNKGEAVTLSFTTNASWEIIPKEEAGWLHISKLFGGKGTHEIEFTAEANTAADERKITLSFISEGEFDGPEITVTQSESTTFNFTEFEFIAAGEQKILIIETRSEWSITDIPEWLTLSHSAGIFGYNPVYMTAAANQSYGQRSAVLKYADAKGEQDITVNQAGVSLTELTPKELIFDCLGETQAINLTSGTDWAFSSIPEWMTLSETSGAAGTYSIEVAATANPTKEARIAKLIYKDFNEEIEITVNQDFNPNTLEMSGNSATVNLFKAGGLSMVLGDKMKSITELRIIGEMNGNDFYCIRQMTKLHNLLSLNLADANIVAGGDLSECIDSYMTEETLFCTKENIFPRFLSNTYDGSCKLEHIQLPETLTEIGDEAFSFCNLKGTLVIPDNVTRIGHNAFDDNEELETLILSKNLQTIGSSAFSSCDGLIGRLIIPDSVMEIGSHAFYHNSLSTIILGESLQIIGESAFAYCYDLAGTLVIPDNVTEIGESAFESCQTLSGLKIGRNVKIIGAGAFDGCGKITGTLVIPDSVTEIGSLAFAHCRSLSSITIGQGLTSIGRRAFWSCTGLTGELAIPDHMVEIGELAFSECKGITSIKWGKNINVINAGTFSNCYGLAGHLDIPDTITKIGDGAFSGCNITSLSIGDGVQTIGNSAFLNCSELTGQLVIPENVKEIGDKAFGFCHNLTGLRFGKNIKHIGSEAFSYCEKISGSLVLPESVTKIGASAFEGCAGFTGALVLNDNLTKIEAWTFYNCTGFTSVQVGSNVISIEDYAFKGCTGLTSATLGESLVGIKKESFYGCSSLESVKSKAVIPPVLYDYSFTGIDASAKLYVPADSKSAYKEAGWGTWFSVIGSL